jgi:hypothetical protein
VLSFLRWKCGGRILRLVRLRWHSFCSRCRHLLSGGALPNKYRLQRDGQGRLILKNSVLRIRDVYPGSWFLPIPDPASRIPDPKTATKERGEKNLLYFFCSHKFHKIESYIIFEMLKKKIWANFQRIIEVFTQKIFTKLSKIWVWDPGSGVRKNLFRIPDPGVKKAPDPGSATLEKFNHYFLHYR